ncbi:MAG: FKBP-type peptidyl-prolyl cis-trans isomerase [Elusimicrobia bacterium]|nr:FKBP-type peptidyl-prolyl cis-trans isomerase [Elusimicrobiota bacterium]
MKTIACLIVLALGPAAYANDSGAPPQTDEQKTLYTLGVILGQNLSQFALTPAEVPYVVAGLRDQVKGVKPGFDLQTYSPKIEQLRTERAKTRAAAEKKKGSAFLEKMAAEKGAKKLPSGVVMLTLKDGTGASPKATDTVRVHYEGTFLDGKTFDSSIQRGQPAEFPLNGVIKCWTEAVQKMKVGGKAKLGCPSDQAYGDEGRPGIPSGSTLIFQVELLDILKT